MQLHVVRLHAARHLRRPRLLYSDTYWRLRGWSGLSEAEDARRAEGRAREAEAMRRLVMGSDWDGGLVGDEDLPSEVDEDPFLDEVPDDYY